MTRVVVLRDMNAYSGLMRQKLGRLLLLIAVLLMPLGMQPAAAAPVAHHAASMSMQHCPDQGSRHDTKAGFVECTMACSAALPAADLPRRQHMLITCSPTAAGVARTLHGLHPDTETPPPKRS